MDSSVNIGTGQSPSQTRKNEASTPAPKFGGIKKKQKKFQLTRRARISLNTSASGRKKIKTLAKMNTSLNTSRIVKEALNHNNRALITEKLRLQNEIQNMRQKCEGLVEENEDIVYELEMLNNLMNLTDSEEKVQAVVDMRVQAHMSQLTDEIEKTVYDFRQALRGVVSLRCLIKDPKRIMSMPLDSPRDDEEIKLSYMERLQELFSTTDIYDEHDQYDNDDNDEIKDLHDNHAGMGQLKSTRGQGFVGLPQRIPCSSTSPEQYQVDPVLNNEFDEALEDDFDNNSNQILGYVQNVDHRPMYEKDVLVDVHQSRHPQSNDMVSTEPSEDYDLGHEDMTMYPNTDMEMTTMIGTTLRPLRSSLAPKSPSNKKSVEPAFSSVKSSPKSSQLSSLSKSSQSSSSKSSSPKSSSLKSSQSRGKSASSCKSSPTNQVVTSSSLKQINASSPLSSNQPATKSVVSLGNMTSSSSLASDSIDPEHTIYLNSDMEMTAVVEAPFSFIEPQPKNQFQKPTSLLQSLKTPKVAPEKQLEMKCGKLDKFGPENLFGFEVETPKFEKPTKTTELSKLDKFERIRVETSFTLDKSVRDECLNKETKSRSRTKPRSKKAVVEEIGIFNSEPSEFHDKALMSEEKRSIEKSQGTSRSKRKFDDDYEDSEPCVLLTIPSEYTDPLNKESPSPKKSKSRSQSRGRSKSKKREKAVISGKSEQKVPLPIGKVESDTKSCGKQESIPDTYTVPMKKDSPVSNIKSSARSQSRGRSKTRMKKDHLSVDTQVNEEPPEKSNNKLLKINKPISDPLTDDLSNVYTIPIKTCSPETKPRLRTRSQSRGRSKHKPVVSSEESSDANTLSVDRHSPLKTEPADKLPNKEVQNQANDIYDVPLKDNVCSKSKSRGRSQSRARSKKRELITEAGNDTVKKDDTTKMDHQNLKVAYNPVGKSNQSGSKTDGPRTSKGNVVTKQHENIQNCTYDAEDIVSPTVHIKPKCFQKRIIQSDDMDSPSAWIKPKAKIVSDDDDDDDEDEMIPDSQPVKTVIPLRSKKKNVLLASETDDEPEDQNIPSSSNSISSTKRKSESPIQNLAKKPKSIPSSPKRSQIILKPEILVIPDSTKKSKSSMMKTDDGDDEEDQENLGKRSRRTKGCVSYKEKPLNVKMRRETVDGKTVEYINTARLSEKVHVSVIQPLDSVSNNRSSTS